MPGLFDFDSPGFFLWLGETYGRRFVRICPDFSLYGSPERSLSRVVIEDENQNRYLLEQVSSTQYAQKRIIAETLDVLFSRGLKQIHPYIRTRIHSHLPGNNGYHFQLSEFIPGNDLVRPDYLSSHEMGNALAGFLLDLSLVSAADQSFFSQLPLFSIKKYIIRLKKEMQSNDFPVYQCFRPFFDFLFHKFMTVHDHLPLAFAHGDFHPMNVIWNDKSILSVIDWEFTGIKPDIYDAANLVGCAGIEDPEGLGMGMVLSFLNTLRSSGRVSTMSWAWFPEYVLALRFAWLAEWLRKKDETMLELEAVYMKILIDHMEELRFIWFKKTGR